MRAFLDDASLSLVRPTFAGAIAAGAEAARARGRSIAGVWLDGSPVAAAILKHPPEVALGREVRMVSGEAVSGGEAGSGLDGVLACLGRAAESQARAAELIQTARLEEALTPLAEAVGAWQEVQGSVAKEMPWAAGLESFDAMIRDLSEKLREVERSLRAQDWSGLSDALAYDMREQAEGWRALIEGVSAGASGEGSRE